ncbi:RNA-binding S4 domain-containing protein [Ectothiorhodospira sp. BSL-9]|uniref:RNA-binding S4 domain-containing protein n=1 Tax=Ectothiorhodospira sp. BSL-9 TaxID=1442136 RepID=UPI0007B438EA|nr:RNA-binding S4 domain-containing protein [Ectothiorhodospira sp. BSL-9]ANB02478.1 tRNA synthetase RNA-binding protein [Ectothiorhodospira sp. BSL-9]TVQ73358.1 MAG: RNA-binding S4 domain-containing protein [Chromatiaceae bacterium]
MNEPATSVRLDKWLWAARFFKTRSLAAEAVSGGRVHVNGDRVKPSRSVRVGDRLRINRSGETWLVDVLGLNDKRRPAAEAQQLYEETPEGRTTREQEAEARRLARLATPHTDHRPDRRDRRHIRRFIGKD